MLNKECDTKGDGSDAGDKQSAEHFHRFDRSIADGDPLKQGKLDMEDGFDDAGFFTTIFIGPCLRIQRVRSFHSLMIGQLECMAFYSHALSSA